MYPFESFSEGAKKALTLTQEEAEAAHQSYIGTEHLLLGLLREGEGLGARVLAQLGVEIGGVRSRIASALGESERIVQGIIPTARVKNVIQLAFGEARTMGSTHVGTEHLLLGLLIEGEGIAAHVLEDLGVSLEKVRGEIDRLEHEMPPEGVAPEHETAPDRPRPPFNPPAEIRTGALSETLVTARFGPRAPSVSDDIQVAAERLAAEQCTVVGVEHALLAALDTDPLVRRMLAALGIDDARIAEARRIATPPAGLVALRREYQARVAQLQGWTEPPSQSRPGLHHLERSARPLGRAELEQLRPLAAKLAEAERRWRAGEEPTGGEPGPGESGP
jgi:hypothetical protein